MIKKILDNLRKHETFYDSYTLLKRAYGKSIGFWYLKEKFLINNGIKVNNKILRLSNLKESDKIIANKIKSNKPFMLAKIGSTEFRNLYSDKDFNHLHLYSGFFPNNPKLLNKFREIYLSALKSVDLLAIWNYRNHFFREIKLIKSLPNVEYLIHDEILNINNSWIKELKNKRILEGHRL